MSGFPRAAAVVLLAVAAGAALASEVREVRLGTLRQWERGRLQSLVLSADGVLALAPDLRALNLGGTAPPPYLLCQARDHDGNLYVGSGGPARVFRFTPHGNATLIFQGDELQATALAIDSKGRIFVTTSPRGRVYRITADGESKPFFETEERYLWSLAVDAADQVWVGTGERGRLYRVDAGGRGTLVLDSPDAHITALAAEPDGSVVAGTDGRGLVYRIGKTGAIHTLLEGGLREVSSLAVAPDRSVVVGLVGPSESPPAAERPPRQRQSESPELRPTAPFEREAPLPLGEESPPLLLTEALEPPSRLTPRSRILVIDPAGAAREVWSSEGEWLHAVAVDAGGTLYFGTGEPARLYRMESGDRPALVARLEAGHLTSISSAAGRLSILTGRPGSVMASGDAVAESGMLESEPTDAGALARWGRVRWQAELPAGARVELFSRTGNSAFPDPAWSDWSAAYADSSGSAIVSPSGRYLQWRIRLSRGREPASPRLREMEFSFLPANRPPRLEQVTLHPPGEYFLPEDGGRDRAVSRPGAPGRPRTREGVRSASWQAFDPDGDPLTATLRIRRQGSAEWKSLADAILAPFYSWSVADLEEGWYEIQVEVSDAGANPPDTSGRALSASQPFKVDHTPPAIEITRNRLAETPPSLEFRVTDALSPVHGVEVWADTAPPRRLLPVDGLEDSAREDYRWQGSAPPKRLRVEAGDSEGNQAEWSWPEHGPKGD